MAHRLKMAMMQTIFQLHSLGWSARRIARELGIDRGTVRKCLAQWLGGAKPAISPLGSVLPKPATLPGSPAPGVETCGGAGGAEDAGRPKPAISPPGSDSDFTCPGPVISPAGGSDFAYPGPAFSPLGSGPPAMRDTAREPGTEGLTGASRSGRRSDCESFRALILPKLELELSARRIYQDLTAEHSFRGSYDSVKRFVRRLGRAHPLPMRRLECAPGYEAQADFGSGATIVTPEDKRRRSHVFRIVLSHSRKAYSEACFRQTTDDFIRCLENAFWQWGGVPETLVLDNLRAAVKHPDWFDPELVPKLQSFAAHYGVAFLPTRPRMPRHKGKVERSVGYVKNNGLKGHVFSSLEEENAHLTHWEATVADTRIHGTTRAQVGKVFEEVERAALRPLPRERFACFQEGRRIVGRDGHVEVEKAYYSVPPEYLSHTLWVRWDSRLVRIFNDQMQAIALHVRHTQGRFSTLDEHLAREKISGLERGAAYLLSKACLIGPHTRQWAEAMLDARGIEGTRVLLGLLSLTKRHTTAALENACEIALSHGAFRLRTIRALLKRHEGKQQTFAFLEEHPIIRPLEDYARVVAAALERQATPSCESHPSGFLRHSSGVQWPQEKQRPGTEVGHQGVAASLTRPRSGYPSSGCTSAEPDSVSPDIFNIAFPSPSFSQERDHE